MQCAFAWSWIGDPFPGFHTSKSYKISLVLKFKEGINAHNIRLVIDILNGIAGIILAAVVVEILDPVAGVRDVRLQQRSQIV